MVGLYSRGRSRWAGAQALHLHKEAFEFVTPQLVCTEALGPPHFALFTQFIDAEGDTRIGANAVQRHDQGDHPVAGVQVDRPPEALGDQLAHRGVGAHVADVDGADHHAAPTFGDLPLLQIGHQGFADDLHQRGLIVGDQKQPPHQLGVLELVAKGFHRRDHQIGRVVGVQRPDEDRVTTVGDRGVRGVKEALHLVQAGEDRLEAATGLLHHQLQCLQHRKIPAALVTAGVGIGGQEVVGLIEQQQQLVGLLGVEPVQDFLADLLDAAATRLGRQDAQLLQPLPQQRPQRGGVLGLTDTGSLQVDVDRCFARGFRPLSGRPQIGVEPLHPPQQRRLSQLAAAIDKH